MFLFRVINRKDIFGWFLSVPLRAERLELKLMTNTIHCKYGTRASYCVV
jgi:hypothetical protein